MKRLFDFTVALTALICLAPLIAFVAGVVWTIMGSPVVFVQKRPGLYGKFFYLYKFRTMRNERDEEGNLLPDDRRLTPLGRFLRRMSLDELPQLFNVLRGDLSIVGPRPLLVEYLPLYSPEQMRRHEVRPGITGWAQVNGRNAISWDEKFKLDIWYVDHQSIWIDLKILWLTVLRVVRLEGINEAGQPTMSKFRGTIKEHQS